MPLDPNAITPEEVEDVFARVLRENVYGGRDLALIEPYNGPRPQSAYATVHLIVAEPERNEVYEFEDRPEGFTETMRGTSWCQVRLQFFGESAFATAIKAKNVLNSNNRLFDLIRATGYGSIGEVKENSFPYQGRIEDRAYFNVDFYANFAAEFLSNYIRRVKGTIKRDDKDNVPYKVFEPR